MSFSTLLEYEFVLSNRVRESFRSLSGAEKSQTPQDARSLAARIPRPGMAMYEMKIPATKKAAQTMKGVATAQLLLRKIRSNLGLLVNFGTDRLPAVGVTIEI